jgi:hypothetical protein
VLIRKKAESDLITANTIGRGVSVEVCALHKVLLLLLL